MDASSPGWLSWLHAGKRAARVSITITLLVCNVPTPIARPPAGGHTVCNSSPGHRAPGRRATPAVSRADGPAIVHTVCDFERRLPVRIAVVGAGAIGAYWGAALHRGGAEVHLIARGRHMEAMR